MLVKEILVERNWIFDSLLHRISFGIIIIIYAMSYEPSHLDWIIAEDPVCKFNLFNLHSLINMHQNNWQVQSLLLLGCRFSLMTVIFHQQFKVAAYWSAIVFGKLLPAFLLSPPSLGCVSWEVADCLHKNLQTRRMASDVCCKTSDVCPCSCSARSDLVA